MKKSITIPSILQSIRTPEEVALVIQSVGYVDTARKFTVYHLLQYWCAAASEEWSGYRSGTDHAARNGLPEVHYSCFSGKAADVPLAVFKELFHLQMQPRNETKTGFSKRVAAH
ncbi:hypothetical protein ACFOQM_02170 [Paenibacillus sp. GCM10012307]|uniref:Uncharacterized protein n=1 Tax=Paenibacillus roseus TaxID=2798579 RepID=A0A934J291_9BACL|nr:hypothetical protein [Paenibacillus roseus]MBJ6360123.1 hypothetical protein [Paenibacillus roseus]